MDDLPWIISGTSNSLLLLFRGSDFAIVKITVKTVSWVLQRDCVVVGYLKLREGKSEMVFSLVGGLYGHSKQVAFFGK